jgi:hypothetical protein
LVALAVFWGLFAYFGWTRGRLVESVLVGLGFGAVGALGMLIALRRRAAGVGASDTRRAVQRLAAMWAVLLLCVVIALAAQSVAVLAIGVAVTVVLSLALRIIHR